MNMAAAGARAGAAGPAGASGALPSRRQRERSQAQQQMDAEPVPGPATLKMALIAFEDRFDDLAVHLLERVPRALWDDRAHAARLVLSWRAGQADVQDAALFERLGRSRDIETLQALLAAAVDTGTLPAALTIRRVIGHLPGHAASVLERRLDAYQGGLGAAPPPHARLLRVVWPPRCIEQPGLGVYEPTAPAAGLSRLWRRWHGPDGEVFHPLTVPPTVPGPWPALAADSVVCSDGFCLDRWSAPWWEALMGRSPSMVITALRVHDPAARSDGLVRQLARHAPIGVADETSRLLLHEWGVRAVVTSPRRPSHAAGVFDLWTDEVSPVRLLDWHQLVNAWSRDPRPQRLVETWRQACAGVASHRAPVPPEPTHHLAAPDVDAMVQRLGQLSRRVLARHASPVGAPVRVAMAVDGQLAEHLPVALEGCLRTERPVQCDVLARGVSEDEMRRWSELFAGRVDLTLWRLDDVHLGGGAHLLAHTTESTLDRLLLPWLLPQADRVVYLDVDLVVLGDIAALHDVPLAERRLAAKPGSSPNMRWGLQMLYHALSSLDPADARAWRGQLHASGTMGFRAFNAGVLVLNLRRMREEHALHRLVAWIQAAGMNDQDALNAYARDDYLMLESSWNAAPRQDPTDGANIVHFVGPVKPWDTLYSSRQADWRALHSLLASRAGGTPSQENATTP